VVALVGMGITLLYPAHPAGASSSRPLDKRRKRDQS
jgi:hypothetical protein